MYNHQQRFMSAGSSRPRGALSSRTASSGSNSAGAIGALADWAARSLDPDAITTPLQMQVERCCDPSNREPNLALNLELADYIKSKKANTPREAAVEVVRRVNSRHPHVSMLALHLLDHLVKNCGYPFHLQIATKEFLNELVRRFPERPPVFPSPAQSKILELIHEWKQTICVTSKHKEDLVHIRDMHRLLGYKGYRFPNVDSRAAGVMNAENHELQSAEELEEEDREAQAAKLQELIRRGTPRDLAQAQELMKIMSGAEPENKPDYAERTRKELDKVQSRAVLLNNMLDNAKEGEKFARGDAYDQIASHLRSLQPRLQKLIGEGDEDGESTHMDRLLLINDLINQVCDRHKSYRKGDFSVQVTIDPSIDPKRGGADAVPTAKITDLISFEDEEPPAAGASNGAAAGAQSTSALDDFASLTFGDAPAKNGSAAPASGASGQNLLADLMSEPSNSSASVPPTPSTLATPFGQGGALSLPLARPANGTSTPVMTPSQQDGSGSRGLPPAGSLASLAANPQQAQQAQSANAAQQAKASDDPFADLSKW